MSTEITLATRVGSGLQTTLRRLATLVGSVVTATVVVSVATFATGWWVFDGSTTWAVVGGALCLVPVLAAIGAWTVLRGSARFAPRVVNDIAAYLKGPRSQASQVLIDYDTGQPLVVTSRSFGTLRSELSARKADLPALWWSIRAITLVPGLAAVAVVGMVVVGGLGTILLIGGLID